MYVKRTSPKPESLLCSKTQPFAHESAKEAHASEYVRSGAECVRLTLLWASSTSFLNPVSPFEGGGLSSSGGASFSGVSSGSGEEVGVGPVGNSSVMVGGGKSSSSSVLVAVLVSAGLSSSSPVLVRDVEEEVADLSPELPPPLVGRGLGEAVAAPPPPFPVAGAVPATVLVCHEL